MYEICSQYHKERAHDTLRMLSEVAAEREHDLLSYLSIKYVESDDEGGPKCPIFETFTHMEARSLYRRCLTLPLPNFVIYSVNYIPQSAQIGALGDVSVLNLNPWIWIHDLSCYEASRILRFYRTRIPNRRPNFTLTY